MSRNVDLSALAGYTYIPSQYNADGTKNAVGSTFRNTLIDLYQPNSKDPEQEAIRDAILAQGEEFRNIVDPYREYGDYTMYGPITHERLMQEYEFVPAWQGVPAGPDPFTVYYDFVDGKEEGYINHYMPSTLPVFSGRMHGTLYPDNHIQLSGNVVGYFVRKGSQAATMTMSVVKIAYQETMTLEDLRDELLKNFMQTMGCAGEREDAPGMAEADDESSQFFEEMQRLEATASDSVL